MEITLAMQTEVFVRAVLLGAGYGALYDVCRAVRRVSHAGLGLTAVLDGVFWLAVLLLSFGFAVIQAPGQARGYLPVGMVLGLWLYLATLSRLILRLLLWVLERVAAALIFLEHGAAFCAVRGYKNGIYWFSKLVKQKNKRKP